MIENKKNKSEQETRQGRREVVKKLGWIVPAAAAAVVLSERPAFAQSGPAGKGKGKGK